MKKIKFISFLFIIFSFCFVVIEISIRIFFVLTNNDIKAFKKYPGRYKESHFTGYDLQKNYELNHKGKKEKINNLGFKGPNISIKKEENTYRIICIGGSLVYGLEFEDTWPKMLQDLLNKNSDDMKYEVINASVPGYTSYHTSTQFITKLIDLNPDLIISYQLFTELWYYHNINKNVIVGDSFRPFATSGSRKSWSLSRMMDSSYLIVFSRALKRIFKKYSPDNEQLPSNAIRKFDNETLKYYKRNMEIIALICQNMDINLLLCTPLSLFKKDNTDDEKKYIQDYENLEFYLEYISEGNTILKEISKKHRLIEHIDMSKQINANLKILSDRYHPNIEGNKAISSVLSKHIEKKIIIKK